MSSYATARQLLFLLQKLQYICDGNDFKSKGKFTKNSFKDLEGIYETRFVQPFLWKVVMELNTGKTDRELHICKSEFEKKYKIQLEIKSESMYDLFKVTDEHVPDSAQLPSSNNKHLQSLALFVLYWDKELSRDDPAKNFESLFEKQDPWDRFRTIYAEEMHDEIEGTYLFYFWHDHTISIALLQLTLNDEKNGWKDYHINFYERNAGTGQYKIDKKAGAKVSIGGSNEIMKSGSLILDVVYYNKMRYMQLIISTRQDIKKDNLYFGSYSGISEAGELSLGIGLLVKELNPARKIDEINKNSGVREEIYNFLFEKRYFIKNDLIKNSDAVSRLPNSGEIDNIKDISGCWKMYYLRNDKPADRQQKGGIEIALFEVEANGHARLLCDYEEDSKGKEYEGILLFPLYKANNQKVVKSHLHLFGDDKIYKLHLFLNVNDTNDIMTGIYTGWNELGKPFSCLVVLRKIAHTGFDTLKNERIIIKEQLKKEVRFIPKHQISITNEFSESLVRFLKNEEKLLDLGEETLPLYLLSDSLLPGSVAGHYYVLSLDFQDLLLDKAKLEIKENGEFTLQYFDVIYEGVARRLILGSNTEQYLSLEIKEKSMPGEEKFKSTGIFIFHIGNNLGRKTDKLSNKINTLPCLSLRVNINGSLQVKKEYLLPAEQYESFKNSGAVKLSYDDPVLFDNVKINTTGERFDLLKERIIDALPGQENNLIVLPKNETVLLHNFREYNYRDIFFKAFLCDAMIGEGDVNTYTNFIEAVIHGISIREAEQRLFELLKKNNIKDAAVKEIFHLLKKAHNEVVNNINKQQVKSLLAHVRNSHTKKTEGIVMLLDKLIDDLKNPLNKN